MLRARKTLEREEAPSPRLMFLDVEADAKSRQSERLVVVLIGRVVRDAILVIERMDHLVEQSGEDVPVGETSKTCANPVYSVSEVVTDSELLRCGFENARRQGTLEQLGVEVVECPHEIGQDHRLCVCRSHGYSRVPSPKMADRGLEKVPVDDSHSNAGEGIP